MGPRSSERPGEPAGTSDRELASASVDAGEFVADRPSDIHTASLAHRYRHYIRTFSKALERRSRDLGVRPGQRLLDYGCAEIPYRHFFPVDLEYISADLPGNPRATLTLNPDGSVPIEDESCDAVVSTQVLEHVTDPNLYLAEAFRVLRPGGRLMLSTHGVFVYHPDPDDYWRWTLAGLRRIVAGAGFVPVHDEGVIGLSAIGLQLIQDALYWKLSTRMRQPLAIVMQSMISVADRQHSAKSKRWNASVYILIAEKPTADV